MFETGSKGSMGRRAAGGGCTVGTVLVLYSLSYYPCLLSYLVSQRSHPVCPIVTDGEIGRNGGRLIVFTGDTCALHFYPISRSPDSLASPSMAVVIATQAARDQRGPIRAEYYFV